MPKLLIVGIIVLVSLGIWWTFSGEEPASGPEVNDLGYPVDQEYISDAYGFSFTYSGELTPEVYTDEHIALGYADDRGFESQVMVRVIERPADEVTSESAFVAQEVQLLCDADGPEGSISCPEIDMETSFTTDAGVSGTVFMLEQVTTTVDGEIVAETLRGPFYVVSLPSDAATVRALVIHPPLTGNDAVVEPLVDQVARSVNYPDAEHRSI